MPVRTGGSWIYQTTMTNYHLQQVGLSKTWVQCTLNAAQLLAAESFKYLFSHARLDSSITSSVAPTPTIPSLVRTWDDAHM